MLRKTLSFSSPMGPGSKAVGGSIAMNASIWKRWVTTMFWLHHQDPWEVARPSEAVEVKLGCSFEMHRGKMELVAGRPSTLIGIPFDRPVVGFGGQTINTLRLWRAAAHDYFDFKEFSGGDFVGALVGNIAASTLTLLFNDAATTEMGQELRFA